MRLIKDFFPQHVDPDEALHERLVEWFRHRHSLKDIDVLVMDRVAILHGRITSASDRALAINLALDAGADDVMDELTLHRPLAAREAMPAPVRSKNECE
jgi:hypothetical protein